MTVIAAASEDDVVEAVREAREKKAPLAIVGGGTKRGFGRPQAASDRVLSVAGLSGIVAYEPEELVLTVRPGTALAVVDSVLAERGQRLGFAPPDWAGLFGESGHSTIGGAVSCDASGPLRIRHGAARDSLLGIRAVNGFGEAFKAGGRVVKNVTGFDIPKLVCGALGTLCVLTELTFRVFPKPPHALTLAVRDIGAADAFALLRRIWSSPLEPTGLAYLPSRAAEAWFGDCGQGVALFRIDGAPKPLEEKRTMLRAALASRDAIERPVGDALFAALGEGAVFDGTPHDVWRVTLPPSEAARTAESIGAPLWYADLAGALLWVGLEADNAASIAKLRAAVARANGHATLLRAGTATRARVSVFPQLSAERAAVTRNVKAAFDPLCLFNPGRMYEGI